MELVIKIFATGFGTGYLKPGPGTWGSLLALVIWLVYPVPLLAIVFASILGVFICQQAENILGEHDSPKIVFDEIIGMWIALWQIPLILYPVAFILFRIFDITKFYPIDNLQKIPGGLGIMLDDVAAGIISRLILALVLVFF